MTETKPTYVSTMLGPHGLGDPDDTSLRRVEKDVKIPQKMRDRARLEKCVAEVKEFSDCAKSYGLAVVAMCRKENTIMQECLGKWFNDKTFQEECTKEYLAERSQYRRTGIPVKSYRIRQG